MMITVVALLALATPATALSRHLPILTKARAASVTTDDALRTANYLSTLQGAYSNVGYFNSLPGNCGRVSRTSVDCYSDVTGTYTDPQVGGSGSLNFECLTLVRVRVLRPDGSGRWKADQPMCSATSKVSSDPAVALRTVAADVSLAASTARIGPYVYFKSTIMGSPTPAQIQPATIQFGERSAIIKIRWSAWNGSEATGRGSLEYNSCHPNCAQARPQYYAVRVVLSRIRRCGRRPFYTKLFFRFTRGRPPVVPRTHTDYYAC